MARVSNARSCVAQNLRGSRKEIKIYTYLKMSIHLEKMEGYSSGVVWPQTSYFLKAKLKNALFMH